MIYHYVCSCGEEIQKEFEMGKSKLFIECPICFHEMYKVIVVPPIQFKGDGFTKTSA